MVTAVHHWSCFAVLLALGSEEGHTQADLAIFVLQKAAC